MSRLYDLIQQLCPNGVPYKTLGEVCIMERGSAITRKTSDDGAIPVIAGGQRPAYYCAKANRFKPCVTVAGSGAYAGFVAYWETPIFVSDAFSVMGGEQCSTKYIYHVLKNMQERIYATKKGGGVPHVHISSISHFRIPVPPMAVQEEIVRILDTFTALEAELEAELEARKKQYAYWRERLLTFDDEAAKIPCGLRQTDRQTDRFVWRPRPAQWVTLGEIATVTRGGNLQKKDLCEMGVPCIHYGQIYTRYGTFAERTLSCVSPEVARRQRMAQTGDIVMAVTSENVEDVCKCVAWLGKEPVAISGHTAIIHHGQNAKFLAYYFQTQQFFDQKRRLAHGTKVMEVSPDALKRVRIPLPSLAEQGRIVGILDKFEALCGDLQSGLPGEIALRRKQFAYYRERLLDFKEQVG